MSHPTEKEEWKPIPGFEGAYSVSSFGRVLSHERRCDTAQGTRRVRQRLLKIQKHSRKGKVARCLVSLRPAKQPEPIVFTTARLVLLAFVGEPEQGQVAHYIDGDCTNSRLENLTWTWTTDIAKKLNYTPPLRTKRAAA